MYLLFILFIFAIAKIDSKIVFDIVADPINPTINFAGTSAENVTSSDMERLFHIDKETMKKYVSAYYNGTMPRKVKYSSSPGDLYKRFKWNPVTQVSSVKFASKKSVFTSPTPKVAFSRYFHNPTDEPRKVNAGIEMPVAIALRTVWRVSDEDYDPFHDFVYDIHVHFNEESGTAGITHTSTLGTDREVYERVVIGRKNFEVVLKPRQSVTAKFSARVCNLEFRAQIVTAVTGNLAVNFKETVQGRHHLGPPIEDVLKHAGFSAEAPAVENVVIKVDFYFDVKVEIFDKHTGLPV